MSAVRLFVSGRDASHEDRSGLVRRAHAEFLEMPGLRLAPDQAARLWGIDPATSERILDALVESGVLWRTRDGSYMRASGV